MQPRTIRWLNRPFPSSLVPLFQNESKSETFHEEMSSTCNFIFMQIKVIFIRMVSHLTSLWNRGTRELRNGLFRTCCKAMPVLQHLHHAAFPPILAIPLYCRQIPNHYVHLNPRIQFSSEELLRALVLCKIKSIHNDCTAYKTNIFTAECFRTTQFVNYDLLIA